LKWPGVACGGTPPTSLWSMKFHTSLRSGRIDVMNDWRDGLHTLSWQYAFLKSSPSDASLSKFGVLAGRP
jgi:hypothetical protein